MKLEGIWKKTTRARRPEATTKNICLRRDQPSLYPTENEVGYLKQSQAKRKNHHTPSAFLPTLRILAANENRQTTATATASSLTCKFVENGTPNRQVVSPVAPTRTAYYGSCACCIASTLSL
jgi:hypothetical protein